jgi:Na+/H+ antiporter
MDLIEAYIILLGISLIVGLLFDKSSLPIPLLLVITGMILSFVPAMPKVTLQPTLVLDIFIPLLLYPASAFLSWKDIKFNLRPIILLSIGHVFFITALVALTIHTLIPQLGWPMSFVLGAIVAPPDDVAILAIADKINFPYRVITILTGESIFNDATALILFRFSLAALLTHQFSPLHAFSSFFLVILGETLYGFLLGHVIGQIRSRVRNPQLQMTASILTPFLAFIPAERMGGCGVLATVVTGLVVGNHYLERFTPEIRLTARSAWTTLGFMLQSLIFILVGLNFQSTLQGISSIPYSKLLQYTSGVIGVVILGRFMWVYPSSYLPRFLFPSLRKKDPYPPWQLPFLVSWAGMRGVISLAAALIIPTLPIRVEGANPKDLVMFLVFSVIVATLLLQGLTIPWIIRVLGLNHYGEQEKYCEHLSELSARVKISKAVLHWLIEYKKEIGDNELLLEKVKLRIREYRLRRRHLKDSLKNHKENEPHDEAREHLEGSFLSVQINELERSELLKLWHKNKIGYTVKNKILQQLDHRFKHING